MASLARRNNLCRVPNIPLVRARVFLCRRRVTIPPLTLATAHSPAVPWAPSLDRSASSRLGTVACTQRPQPFTEVASGETYLLLPPLLAVGLDLYRLRYGASRRTRLRIFFPSTGIMSLSWAFTRADFRRRRWLLPPLVRSTLPE